MAEPITTGVTAGAVSMGLATLLVGLVGQVGADIMMVVLASIAGCVIALTGQNKSYKDSILYIIKGILISVVLAWAISGAIVGYFPSINTPHLPSIIAFVLGFSVDKLKGIVEVLLSKIMSKIGA